MSNDWSKVLIPMIRKTMPGIIAEEIVSVQPMDDSTAPTWKLLESAVAPNGTTWYRVRVYRLGIISWIEEQDNALWKDRSDYPNGRRFDLHESLYTMFATRWS